MCFQTCKLHMHQLLFSHTLQMLSIVVLYHTKVQIKLVVSILK